MYRASQEELQTLLITAEKLSHYYHRKYPDIPADEFYSIAQVAIAEALKSHRKGKKLTLWVSQYIYSRFADHLKNQNKPIISTCREIAHLPEVDITSIIDRCGLTPKEKEAAEYYLQHSEPPPNRNALYRACRKMRAHLSVESSD
jgi:hypothetical protein